MLGDTSISVGLDSPVLGDTSISVGLDSSVLGDTSISVGSSLGVFDSGAASVVDEEGSEAETLGAGAFGSTGGLDFTVLSCLGRWPALMSPAPTKYSSGHCEKED